MSTTGRITNFYEEIPQEPTEQPTPAPDPSPEPPEASNAEVVAEGQPTPPSEGEPEPAEQPTPQAEPRESAMAKRARELREKAAGQTQLANKLDPNGAAAPQPTPQVPRQPAASDQPDGNYYDEEGNIDPSKLDAYIDARADRRYQAIRTSENIVASRQDFVKSVDTDSKALIAAYPELDPKSDKYNADLDDAITAAFTNAATDASGNVTRVDLSLRSFAEPLVDVYRKQAERVAASVPNTTVASTVDAATVPGATPVTPAKAIEDMTADELEAHLIAKHGKPVQR